VASDLLKTRASKQSLSGPHGLLVEGLPKWSLEKRS